VRDARVLKLLIAAAPNVVGRTTASIAPERRESPTARAVDNAIVRIRQAPQDDEGELIRSVRDRHCADT
jgi:DNA-binding response OmpR family regulator